LGLQGEIYMEINKDQIDDLIFKPTLMSKPVLAPMALGGESETRILSNLGMGSSAEIKGNESSTRLGFKLIAFFGLFVIATILGYQYLSGSNPNTQYQASPSAPAVPVLVATALHPELSATTVPAQASSAVIPVPAQQAAQIVNEPSLINVAAQGTPVHTSNAPQLTAVKEESAKTPVPTHKTAHESKAVTKERAISKSVNTKRLAANQAAEDEDVNLLAALIMRRNASLKPAAAPVEQPVVTQNAATKTPKNKEISKPATSASQPSNERPNLKGLAP
jgi:hypothetical protein